MKRSPGGTRSSLWPLRRGHWRLLQAVLLISGIGLLLISSTFLLGGGWNEAPAPRAAAYPAEPQIEATQTPEAPSAAPPEQNDRSPASDGGGVSAAAGALDVTQPTQTPTSISAPFPTPTSPPPAIPQQPTATPRQVAAPISNPTLPPPPPPTSPPASLPEPTATPIPASCPTAAMPAFAVTLFNEINSERTQAGLLALTEYGCVVYVAQLRSQDMADRSYFSHSSPEGETAFSLMDTYGVAYGWAGENLARNNYPDDETVAVAIRDLMASEGHRTNILNENFTRMGVGMAIDSEGIRYYTMLFVGPP